MEMMLKLRVCWSSKADVAPGYAGCQRRKARGLELRLWRSDRLSILAGNRRWSLMMTACLKAREFASYSDGAISERHRADKADRVDSDISIT